MKIKLEVELIPFTVPNFVRVKSEPRPRQDGIQNDKCYALHELDNVTLHDLCVEFTEAVMTKAAEGRSGFKDIKDKV